jgi:hypothetical protein
VVQACLESEIVKPLGKMAFLRAMVHEKEGRLFVRPTEEQGSGMLLSLVKANGLMMIEEDREKGFYGNGRESPAFRKTFGKQLALKKPLTILLEKTLQEIKHRGLLGLDPMPSLSLELPKRPGLGDISTTLAMTLAPQEKKPPHEIAELIISISRRTRSFSTRWRSRDPVTLILHSNRLTGMRY